MTTITITREKMARNRMGGGGPGPAWTWRYYATGPDTIEVPTSDGACREVPRKFDNAHLSELRAVLRRAYGRDVQIVEAWR